jgi:hypothetical protein
MHKQLQYFKQKCDDIKQSETTVDDEIVRKCNSFVCICQDVSTYLTASIFRVNQSKKVHYHLQTQGYIPNSTETGNKTAAANERCNSTPSSGQFRPVPGSSGQFRPVPGSSGQFLLPFVILALSPFKIKQTTINLLGLGSLV